MSSGLKPIFETFCDADILFDAMLSFWQIIAHAMYF